MNQRTVLSLLLVVCCFGVPILRPNLYFGTRTANEHSHLVLESIGTPIS